MPESALQAPLGQLSAIQYKSVRSTVSAIYTDVDMAAEETGESREAVLRRLLDAALNPLASETQASIRVLRAMWGNAKIRKERWDKMMDKVVAKTLDDIRVEHPATPITGPQKRSRS